MESSKEFHKNPSVSPADVAAETAETRRTPSVSTGEVRARPREVRKPATVSPGDVVTGTVEQIMPFGAFVRLENGLKAMVHISQLSHKYVKSVDAVLSLQQQVKAKVIKIDERGRIDLSIKALEEPPIVQPRFRPHFNNSAESEPVETDDFEKKLASFMKTS